MSFKKSFGKSIVLLIIILILVFGGLIWFNFLGVVSLPSIRKTASKALGKAPQTSTTVTQSKPLVSNLDEDRLRKQREANDIFKEELDKREADIASLENQNAQIAAELAEREKNQEEREKTFNNEVKKYDDRNTNIEQISTYLQSMRPKTAVEQLLGMDDQDIIDILRKTDALAEASRTASMTSVWLMNMPAERAAVIQRKMASKPEKLD